MFLECAELSSELQHKYRAWEETLPKAVTIPRALLTYREPIETAELHAFGDASTVGVSTAVYAVLKQSTGISKHLVAAKSRLAKRGLTIPRLELVAAHMSVNLLVNTRRALGDQLLTPKLYAWTDSTVALWWINGTGNYKQFVANRVAKIQAHSDVQWRYIPTAENPADLGSRGGKLTQLWLNGPTWLDDKDNWPAEFIAQILKEPTLIQGSTPASAVDS